MIQKPMSTSVLIQLGFLGLATSMDLEPNVNGSKVNFFSGQSQPFPHNIDKSRAALAKGNRLSNMYAVCSPNTFGVIN
ncbi:hypothetical protein PR001_g19451 [Phytophthora rubi]|uniref:RxLR effector protein n=1 Tax=Phytophthora rubi TaxID=129364 RepID=A0A6A3JRY5_9STRA|nr:hypothetical protein PR002_g20099 [Phytophthora rubi]KAE8997950.1 hypothetical protein PR001_g19451 [Phytophthora rubi]